MEAFLLYYLSIMKCNKRRITPPVSLTFLSLNVIFVMENYEERSVLSLEDR